MKKVLMFSLAFILVIAMSVAALAASDNGKGSGNGSGNGNGNRNSSINTNSGDQSEKTNLQKQFKTELTAQKKVLNKEKSALEAQKEQLEATYQELLAQGDQAGADVILEQINGINEDITTLQAQIKQIINERYMVVKTLYSEEELAQFESAADLIEQMYADATALGAGCVIIRDNIIKFDAPPYVKGQSTLIPVRAITEGLGAAVSWNETTQSVSISKDDTTVVITLGSNTVTVNGTPVELGTSADSTCGRVYVPLRFLAETFGLQVDWDDETGTVDIAEPDAEGDGDEIDGEAGDGNDEATDDSTQSTNEDTGETVTP